MSRQTRASSPDTEAEYAELKHRLETSDLRALARPE